MKPEDFDATLWAKAFCEVHPEANIDEMTVWFANALMTGYNYRIFHIEQGV